ncbi:HEPN/Toprim-associated domain-containing protein [Flavobacterium cerinum]|uniref:HEPN/Toprim-associated domain-containing protein n=1 Tax=Flavobacterium cerinum TaxID=2502784 RepID=A0ABY5IWH5_9FLAO|nr:HEPN/Toprim-associated domain-containing protein [Flavobacterium cerinum]UUC47169.1 HEPN/Toprim-associated domain-containing protein [Flavobacterium cerinum]
MGSYCSLTLGGYEIDQSKSYINPFWSCFFNEQDKRSRSVPYDLYYTQPLSDTDEVPTYEYAASVETMKLRLEIMGYTLEKVKREFVEGIERALHSRQQSSQEFAGSLQNNDVQHLSTLMNGGFEHWLISIRYIFDQNITIYSEDIDKYDGIYRFILEYNDIDEDLYLGYPNIGMGYFIRAALEAVDLESELILDVTSLVSSGYYEEDELICAGTAQSHIDSTLAFQKVIILTEGSTDSEILSKSLKLLFPKVESYFSFLDFDSYKAEGGSAMLEKTIKSFAAAGINNKIIGLFDYDAAGVAAIARLKKRNLPANFRIMNLPSIQLAEKYPTLGPQGNTNENVNGRACSIEMYLGTDILTDISGQLAPVEWKGIEHQINIYQGELSRKAELQKKFYLKVQSSIDAGALQPGHDWSGLTLVFENIFAVAATINQEKKRPNVS